MAKDKKKIIWLSSYPKSGNTWIRAFLANYYHNNDFSDLNKLSSFIPSFSSMHLYQRNNDGIEPTNDESAPLRKIIAKNISNNIKGKSDFIILKNHNARVKHLGHEVIPEAYTDKAIYVVRNPLDVVDSFSNHTEVDLDTAISTMCNPVACLGGKGTITGLEILTTWSGHVSSWMYGQAQYQTLVIRYEDLLVSPELYFRNIISFLGWKVFEDRLTEAIASTKFEKLKAFEDDKGFKEKFGGNEKRFFRKGKHSRWSEVLNDDQVRQIIKTNGLMMQRLGYLNADMMPIITSEPPTATAPSNSL